MKKILFAAFALVLLAGVAAAEDCPPLLCDSAPPPVVDNTCPPAPPVCAPAPVCAEPAKVEVCKVVEVPVRKVVQETRTVPVKKKVWEEECYVDNEIQYETFNEVRTRTAYRKVPMESTKEIYDICLTKVEPCTGRGPRLSRRVNVTTVPTTIQVKEAYEETYTVPVKQSFTVPVTKTRKVARVVEEYKTVTVPTTVTVMETRVAKR
jgi:hypothetical protein